MPPTASTPHDALFKSTFSQVEHAAGELRLILPAALVGQIDFATLALCPGSFVDEALNERHSDLLFSASLRGRRALFYVLFEHQSRVDQRMAFRLLRYMLRIWEAWERDHPNDPRLPLLVPVVLHHSADGWTGSTAFEHMFDVDPETLAMVAEHVPRFRFLLDDISHETDDRLAARAMTALGRLCLWCLRHAREPGELVTRLGAWATLVSEVRRAPNGPAALRSIWRYILMANHATEPEEIIAQLLAAAGDEGKEEIVTLADWFTERGFQKGIEKGIEKGVEKGIERGQRETLLKLFRTRFGSVPESAAARVMAAGPAELDRWTERVLSAPTLAAVLDGA